MGKGTLKQQIQNDLAMSLRGFQNKFNQHESQVNELCYTQDKRIEIVKEKIISLHKGHDFNIEQMNEFKE